MGSWCMNADFEFGETDAVKQKRRSPLKIHSNWNKHANGKEHELRHTDWTGGGLSVEVNEEGIRRVAWSSIKDGLRYPFWVYSSQRGQVVGPSRSRVYHKKRATRNKYKSGFKSLKWVARGEKPIVGLDSFCDTRGLEKPVLDSGPNGDTSMGFPNFPNIPELNPIRLDMGDSSSLADLRLTAPDSVLVASSKTPFDSSGSTESTMEVGSTESRTPVRTTGLATPVPMTGLSSPMGVPRSDVDERNSSATHMHMASLVGATLSKDKGVVAHQHWASPMDVSGCIKFPLKMGFKFCSDRNSTLGFYMLSGGLISEGKRLVILDFVPRLVGPSFPDLFLEFLRAGSMGLGVSGQEANSFSSKELFKSS